MADKSLMEEMLPMKISNWESIEYSEGLNCVLMRSVITKAMTMMQETSSDGVILLMAI